MNKNIGFLLLALCSASVLNGMESDNSPAFLDEATVPQDYSALKNKLNAWIANHPKTMVYAFAAAGTGLVLATGKNVAATDSPLLAIYAPVIILGTLGTTWVLINPRQITQKTS